VRVRAACWVGDPWGQIIANRKTAMCWAILCARRKPMAAEVGLTLAFGLDDWSATRDQAEAGAAA